MTSRSQALVPGTTCSRLAAFTPCGSQLGQRLLLHAVKIRVAARQADFHMGHRADQPVSNDFRGLMKGRNRTLPRAHLPDNAVLLDCANNGLLFGDGVRERLFGVDVFLAARGFSGDDLMPMIGHGDHHGIDVVAGKQLPVIVIAFAILGPVVRRSPS